jgi:hypothetical protein
MRACASEGGGVLGARGPRAAATGRLRLASEGGGVAAARWLVERRRNCCPVAVVAWEGGLRVGLFL